MSKNAPTEPRPWSYMRDEETHGPWADYEAWERWINNDDDWLEALDFADRGKLYAAMCDQLDPLNLTFRFEPTVYS